MAIEIKHRITGDTIIKVDSGTLEGANLRDVNLTCADLTDAYLRDANLKGADLIDADLKGANLTGAKTDKRYVQVSCIGSAKRMTTYCVDDDIIWCGCFKGTLDEFEQQVTKTHEAGSQYHREYIGFINYLKSLK